MLRVTVVFASGMTLGVAMLSAVAVPASAFEACVIHVDNPHITLRIDRKSHVQARIVGCPSGVLATGTGYGGSTSAVHWNWRSAVNDERLNFSYNPGNLFPNSGMSETLSASYAVGDYRLEPSQEDTYWNGSTMVPFALATDTPVIRAKLGQSVSLSVSKRGSTRTLKVKGKRWVVISPGYYWTKMQPAKSVKILRNGKVWRTVRLAKGKVTVRATKKARWSARLAEDSSHWSATSTSVLR